MSDTQTAGPIAQLSEQVAALTDAVQRIGGYAGSEEWDWVECHGEEPWQRLAPREGAEPLRAEIRTDLLNYEVEAIPIESGTPMRDVWKAIAPHIRDWNVRALNTETGEWNAVPAPRVMGIDAFRYVKPLAAEWMAFVVKFARLRDIAYPKGGSNFEVTESQSNEPASDSPAPASASRKSRKATT